MQRIHHRNDQKESYETLEIFAVYHLYQHRCGFQRYRKHSSGGRHSFKVNPYLITILNHIKSIISSMIGTELLDRCQGQCELLSKTGTLEMVSKPPKLEKILDEQGRFMP